MAEGENVRLSFRHGQMGCASGAGLGIGLATPGRLDRRRWRGRRGRRGKRGRPHDARPLPNPRFHALPLATLLGLQHGLQVRVWPDGQGQESVRQ